MPFTEVIAELPSVLLKNAAVPGTRYPMIGLGFRGPNWQLGEKAQCWHYPNCCTHSWCPSINATRDWLKMGGWRLDTGYPFGDTSSTPPHTCGGHPPSPSPSILGGHYCDAHGIKAGIKASGVKRKDIFLTIKYGFAGPMQGPDEGDKQGDNMIGWLGTNYTDLALMHEGDLGTSGHHPSEFCEYPTTDACRIRIFKGCIAWMGKGKTRACGVANWKLKWLQALKDANVTLPSVVQMKFHPHQSTASPRIQSIKAFCDKHNIIFNGYSPLGRADWTKFLSPMKETLFEEPLILDIAKKVSRTPAQVLLRWNIQQGIPTEARTSNVEHMKENLNVFNWTLSSEDMKALSSMPQCNITRGNPYMKGDPSFHGGDNMIGPTPNC